MQGFVLNVLKLKRKKSPAAIILLGVVLLSACSLAPVKDSSTQAKSSDRVTQRTQDAWEKEDHTASADFHFALAQAYSTEGKVELAIEEFRAALIYDPNSAMLHSKLAPFFRYSAASSLAIAFINRKAACRRVPEEGGNQPCD